ncbi:MAG TPA: hypothetical protein VD905_14225 [Flavobacteriales bacterium]|nr:hypothetical protein [Flavobacteriales bacterium]
MRKPLPVFLLFLTLAVKAQEPFKYRMQFDIAGGGTLFNVPNSVAIADNPQAFGICLGLDALASVKGPFSIGLSFLHHQYATDDAGTDNTQFLEAKSSSFQFIAQYHLIDKKRINVCVGTGVGVHSFDYDRIDVVDSVSYTGHVKLKGPAFMANLQVRYYFIKNLGLFLRPQFLVYGGKMDEFVINGQSYERIEGKHIDDIIYSFRGTSVQFGLSLRF